MTLKNTPYLRVIVLFCCFALLLARANAQTAFLSLNDVTACPVSDVTVTLHVEDLFNVGAVTLYIGYDTAVLEYDGHGNVHPQFIGMISNAVTVPTTQVNIVWSSTTPGNISSGTLLELYFIYKGGSSALSFRDNCDITSVNLVPIPFTTDDGSVSIQPYITENPQHSVVSAGTNATFSVTANGAGTYQWQEFNGSGWNNLLNSATYQNVNGPQLTIIETPQALDGYWYRCFLTDGGDCDATSDSAMLTVLPELTALLVLPSAGSCPGESVAIPVQGYALDDVIEFGFFISYLPSVAVFTGLANVHPVIDGTTATVHTMPVPHVQVAWAATNGVSIPDGVLFELVFDFNQGTTPLIFMEQSFALNANQYAYTLSTINGQITTYAVPQITAHPANVTIYAGSNAEFTVQANNADRYQWYESQDNGSSWDILQNQGHYAGVQTLTLSISAVPVSFDQFRYKCLVSSLNCDVFSNSALLTVDTLSSVRNPGLKPSGLFMLTSSNMDGSNLNLGFDLPVAGSLNIRLYDLTGKLVQLSQYDLLQRGKQSVSIILPKHNTGIILMQSLFEDLNGNVQKLTKKILQSR